MSKRFNTELPAYAAKVGIPEARYIAASHQLEKDAYCPECGLVVGLAQPVEGTEPHPKHLDCPRCDGRLRDIEPYLTPRQRRRL